MSLFDSIQNVLVNTVMSQNTGLSKITSTTFSQTGTSINSIRGSTITSVNTSLGNTNYDTQLYSPITQMGSYAFTNATSPAQQSAITTATNNAYAAVDSSFNSAFPTASANTLYDVQSASTQAISTGVSSFGTALGGINPGLVPGALNVGNSALVTAGTTADGLCSSIFNSATSSVNSAVAGINSAVAGMVSSKSAATAALGPVTSAATTAANASAASSAAANVFSSAGVSAITEGATDSNLNNTDVIYQDIKLYIEGVQVPFESISISQGIGNLPTASIQIPPMPGLLDIARYYQPKVHIFFTDKNFGGDRLLFWGHILVGNYSKSRAAGSSSVTFHCEHKNALLSTFTLEFTGYASNASTLVNDANPEQASAKVNSFNSQESITMALQGITGLQSSSVDLLDPSNKQVAQADVTKLSQRFQNFENRFQGLPSAIMNFWNQLKKDCYSNVSLNTIMADMYIPLIEDGIAFFDRLAGHYVIETLVNGSKEAFCPGGASPAMTANPVMIPPAYRLNSQTAIQSDLAVSVVNNTMGFSGELTNFLQLFADFFASVEYEILTLASPALIPADPTANVGSLDNPSTYANVNLMAVETIIKPQIPFYYSPMCNVVYPKMYSGIEVTQDESQIPTRLTAFSDIIPGSQGTIGSQYHAPNSIRESIAYGATLSNAVNALNLQVNLEGTTGQSFNVPGKYETGRGVKHKRITLPNWLAQMLKGKLQELGSPNMEAWPDKTDPAYQALCDLHAAWIDRYGYDTTTYDDGTTEDTRNTDKDTLDPYSPKAQIHPFQRLLFATADYEYTKAVVASRMGSLEGVFNPYIVPGYPMEILDDSPNAPSFHAMCSSVTHSITARGITTSIGFVAACTYTEMVNYYMQPLHPWLQTALQIVNTSAGPSGLTSTQGDGYGNPPDDLTVNSSIVFNTAAKAQADNFYLTTLGVNSVAIDDLYDFDMGRVVPVRRIPGTGLITESTPTSQPSANGGEKNDFLTTVGNLRLAMRPIEGKQSIQAKFGLQFIDLTSANYNPTSMLYQNPQLDSASLLEPGASLFLDYQEVADFISNSDATAAVAVTTTSASTGSGAPIGFGTASNPTVTTTTLGSATTGSGAPVGFG